MEQATNEIVHKNNVEHTVNLQFIADLLRGDTIKLGRGETVIKLDMVEAKLSTKGDGSGGIKSESLWGAIKCRM